MFSIYCFAAGYTFSNCHIFKLIKVEFIFLLVHTLLFERGEINCVKETLRIPILRILFESHLYFLKVLTNDKRCGLKVASVDRSLFKLFTLKFSSKSMQVRSFERFKITLRTMFLYPISGIQ